MTLHYQIFWQVQNHLPNINNPSGHHSFSLTIDATKGTTQCIQISKYVSREEFLTILQNLWLRIYERLRFRPQNLHPIKPVFTKNLIKYLCPSIYTLWLKLTWRKRILIQRIFPAILICLEQK